MLSDKTLSRYMPIFKLNIQQRVTSVLSCEPMLYVITKAAFDNMLPGCGAGI
jgi:hypothetical protein